MEVDSSALANGAVGALAGGALFTVGVWVDGPMFGALVFVLLLGFGGGWAGGVALLWMFREGLKEVDPEKKAEEGKPVLAFLAALETASDETQDAKEVDESGA